MLSFGFITDFVIEIPNEFTEEEFIIRYKKMLFDHFFYKIEKGCTKFYTFYQSEYTCYAIETIKKIEQVTGVNIEVYLLFETPEHQDLSLPEVELFCSKLPTKTAVIPIVFYETGSAAYAEFEIIEGFTSTLASYNILMSIVESCSSMVFYASRQLIHENNHVSTILEFCDTYSIDVSNIYDKITL